MNAAEIFNNLKNEVTSLDKELYPGTKLSDIPIDRLSVEVIPTGFPSLDERLFLKKDRGELIVVAGNSSHGKSAFMFQLAFNVAHQMPVHIYSLEMDEEQILTRILANSLDVSITSIQRGLVSPVSLGMAHRALEVLDYTIDDRSSLDVEEICSLAEERTRDLGTGLIIIDYLQIVKCKATYSRSVEVGNIIGAFKALAKKLKVPVIVASQLNRMNEVRGQQYGDYRPMLSDLKESGSIEQDADIVAFVFRESRYKNVNPNGASIIIAKNRNGQCGEIKMRYDADRTRFVDLKS